MQPHIYADTPMSAVGALGIQAKLRCLGWRLKLSGSLVRILQRTRRGRPHRGFGRRRSSQALMETERWVSISARSAREPSRQRIPQIDPPLVDSKRNQMLEKGGGPGRNRTGVHGFAVRCVTTPPPGHPGVDASHVGGGGRSIQERPRSRNFEISRPKRALCASGLDVGADPVVAPMRKMWTGRTS